MPVMDLGDWLDEQMEIALAPMLLQDAAAEHGVLWYAKRLSANDTQATGGHQAGFYIPKRIAFLLIPSLHQPSELNPRVEFEMLVDSHPEAREVRAIWYNKKLHGGTNDEVRVTGLGGASRSPLLDPALTGALAVFAFHQGTPPKGLVCHVWVCEHDTEADLIEERIGPVETGQGRLWPDLLAPLNQPGRCWLEPDELPRTWLDNYPTGEEVLRKVLELRPERSASADARLSRRRDCEEALFYSIENAIEFPRIRERFWSFDSFGEIIDHMMPSIQRRRSRSGNSLQLQIREIFREEGLDEGTDFSYQPISERRNRPDFLFPSVAAYRDQKYPQDRLRMLAVKTSLRDRWRQVLREADRIGKKHLLTLDTAVTEELLNDIDQADIQLVVPRSLHRKYPDSARATLQTVEEFIGEVRALAG